MMMGRARMMSKVVALPLLKVLLCEQKTRKLVRNASTQLSNIRSKRRQDWLQNDISFMILHILIDLGESKFITGEHVSDTYIIRTYINPIRSPGTAPVKSPKRMICWRLMAFSCCSSSIHDMLTEEGCYLSRKTQKFTPKIINKYQTSVARFFRRQHWLLDDESFMMPHFLIDMIKFENASSLQANRSLLGVCTRAIMALGTATAIPSKRSRCWAIVKGALKGALGEMMKIYVF